MADTKITALNALVIAEDGDLLAIVDDPLGMPETKKITSANFVASTRAYGQIYTVDGVGSQTLTNVNQWYRLTQFDSDGGLTNNVTEDSANNLLTVGITGVYIVWWQLSFTGTANTTFEFMLYDGGVAQPQSTTARRIGSTGDIGSCSGVALLSVPAVPTNIELYARNTSGASRNISITHAQLVVRR